MASRSIARGDRHLGARARVWFRVTAIIVILLAILIPHLLWRLFSRHSPFARLFLAGAGWAAGVRITITGRPVQGRVLFIANHVSWLDILVLAHKTGTAFVGKADMARWPLLGWLAAQNNTIFVNREAALDAHNQANMLQKALRQPQPVTIFPEGTTGDGLALLPFRSSLLAAVAPPPPGVTIQPVAIDYGDAAPSIAWTGEESVGHNALGVMSRRGRLTVTLHFLDPIPFAELPHRKLVTSHARAAIAAVLGQA
jgi:lyso-ornithine lipid O-acyltransferase